MRSQHSPIYVAYAAVLLGFLLRSYQLGADGFIGDEAFTGLLARQPLGDIVSSSLRADPHPPTHTLITWAWRPWAGESEFALRFPVAVEGTLLIPLMFRLGATIGGPRMGVAAAMLAAGNPFLIRLSQLGRMYSGAATGSVLSALLCVRGLRGKRPPQLNYILTSLVGFSFHYFALTTLAAQGLITLLARPTWPLVRRWIGAQTFVAIIALAWLATAWPFLRHYRLSWLTANMSPQELFLSFFWASHEPQPPALWLGGTAALVAVAGLSVARRSVWGLFAPALTLLPWGVVLVLSFLRDQPMVLDRYVMVMAAGLLLWLAQGLSILRPWLALTAGACVAIAWAPALQAYYDEVGISTSAEMRAFREDMTAIAAGRPLVLSNLAASDPYFQWYVPPALGLISTYVVTLDYSHPIPFDPDEVRRESQGTLADHREVWLLGLGYPSAPAAIDTERALEASSYRLSERWHGSVRWLRYFRPSETTTQLGLQFLAPEGGLYLEAYGLTPDLGPGYLGLRLDWRAETQVAASYGVFVHLLDESGRTVAQGDSDPQWGYAPTSTWQPGETVVDRHVVPLPSGLPAGTYRIALGLYDDQRRLLLPDGDNRWLTPPFQLRPF